MRRKFVKIVLGIILVVNVGPSFSQHFNHQFYFEQSADLGFPITGSMASINDSLAYIKYSSEDALGNRGYFACRYRFVSDTLFVEELDTAKSLDEQIEYSRGGGVHFGLDSVFLGYQPYYVSGGWPLYDSLIFEVDGKKYAYNHKCDTYCSKMPRPDPNSFNIKILNGRKLLLTFKATLSPDKNVIRMTHEIFETHCCNFWFQPLDKMLAVIPESIKIYNEDYSEKKEYTLIVSLKPREFGFTIPSGTPDNVKLELNKGSKGK